MNSRRFVRLPGIRFPPVTINHSTRQGELYRYPSISLVAAGAPGFFTLISRAIARHDGHRLVDSFDRNGRVNVFGAASPSLHQAVLPELKCIVPIPSVGFKRETMIGDGARE